MLKERELLHLVLFFSAFQDDVRIKFEYSGEKRYVYLSFFSSNPMCLDSVHTWKVECK